MTEVDNQSGPTSVSMPWSLKWKRKQQHNETITEYIFGQNEHLLYPILAHKQSNLLEATHTHS